MRKKRNDIPVNVLPAGIGEGIIIRKTSFHGVADFEPVARSHRDGGHSFFLQIQGTTHIEIDFQEYHIKAPAVVYISPDQVHRLIGFEKAVLSSWIITSENLQPECLKALEDLAPVTPLSISADTLTLLSAAADLSIRLAERKQEKWHYSVLKQSCNTLVLLVASQYLTQSKPSDKLSRYETVSSAFKLLLEKDFLTVKSPAVYAKNLNISAPYLNECIKNTTGYPVSWHIQQRVMLEAKRLLYHSTKSIKEVAGFLGYDDFSYFTRLFVKVTGASPIAFRAKKHE